MFARDRSSYTLSLSLYRSFGFETFGTNRRIIPNESFYFLFLRTERDYHFFSFYFVFSLIGLKLVQQVGIFIRIIPYEIMSLKASFQMPRAPSAPCAPRVCCNY